MIVVLTVNRLQNLLGVRVLLVSNVATAGRAETEPDGPDSRNQPTSDRSDRTGPSRSDWQRKNKKKKQMRVSRFRLADLFVVAEPLPPGQEGPTPGGPALQHQGAL